jgi:hypothetical protein
VECESQSYTDNNRATGTVSKAPKQYLSNIAGKIGIEELQKAAILDTAHKMREVMMYRCKTYCRGEITLRVTQTVNTEQLQHCVLYCTVQTGFVSGI